MSQPSSGQAYSQPLLLFWWPGPSSTAAGLESAHAISPAFLVYLASDRPSPLLRVRLHEASESAHELAAGERGRPIPGHMLHLSPFCHLWDVSDPLLHLSGENYSLFLDLFCFVGLGSCQFSELNSLSKGVK